VSDTVYADPRISGFSRNLIGQINAYDQGAKPMMTVLGINAVAGMGVTALGELTLSGAGTPLAEDLSGVLSRASSAVGNQGAKVASREVAEQAAKEWVGEGAEPILADHGTGAQIGWKSADGTRIVRFTSAESKGYINLVNKITGGNLHVRW